VDKGGFLKHLTANTNWIYFRRPTEMTSLLNRAQVKRHVLMIAHESENKRLHKYERVSKSTLDYLEARLKLEIRELIKVQRTGITIKP